MVHGSQWHDSLLDGGIQIRSKPMGECIVGKLWPKQRLVVILCRNVRRTLFSFTHVPHPVLRLTGCFRVCKKKKSTKIFIFIAAKQVSDCHGNRACFRNIIYNSRNCKSFSTLFHFSSLYRTHFSLDKKENMSFERCASCDVIRSIGTSPK